MKFCPKCQQEKSLSDFAKNKSRKDGLSHWCKPCVNCYNKSYYAKNSERIKETVNKYRDANQEVIKSKKQSYARINSTRLVKKANDWKKANPERVALSAKKFRANHKEIIASYAHNRRAKMKSNGIYAISEKEIKALYSQQCAYCGSFDKIQIDHVVPISKGGSHSTGNLLPACAKCNIDKKDLFLIVWKLKKRKEQNGTNNY